ncbi:alpha/beta hydrolase [soil metagenome]
MRSWMKRRWKFYLTAIVCLEIFVAFAGCANTFLLIPSTDKREAMGATSRPVMIGSNTLEIWTQRSKACGTDEPKAYVLEFCGNGTRAEDIAWFVAERWAKWPVEVWCMNYPGYGGSTGPAYLKSIPPAALATYDSLRAIAGSRPIFLEANSLGTTAAIYVAANRPTPALVLQNPPPLRRLIFQHHGWWNLWLLATPVTLQIPIELNSPSWAPLVHAPACFLLADEDEVVPPKYHDMVVDAYVGPKLVINLPYATHNSPVDAASEKIVRQWIAKQWDQAFPTTQPVR